MLKPRSLTRLRQVATVFIRNGFEDVLQSYDLMSWMGFRRRRVRKPAERLQKRAENFRETLEELGATYIKLGQLLSTRPDILPTVFVEELTSLQDHVEPVPFKGVREVLERELSKKLDDVFERFDKKPVASASIAQVYRARLRPGVSKLEGEVAVKVVKPGVPELVESDMEILREVADRLSRSTLARRYDFEGLSSQLDATLKGELDLRQEASNARRIRESMKEFTGLRVPEIAEELTRKRVLVMEYIEGTKLTAVDQPRPELADELWRAYLKQILVDGAFQCDPHPGNFLIDAEGRLAVLDYGMIAYVSRENQLRLMALLITLVERDGDRTARACIEMGILGKNFREARFRGEVGHLVARYSGVTLKDLPFGLIVRDLLVLCVRNDIQIPPEMALLGKTLLNLEPMCRRLDPDMDPVSTMKDAAMRLLEGQIRRDVSTERLMSLLLEVRSILYDVPLSVRRVLTQLANNELRLGIEIEKAEQMQVAVRDVANRITLGVITAALIMGSALLVRMGAGPTILDLPIISFLGFLLAAGLGIYVVFQILTGRH
jgi:predicted unusual protein kinase regulating ubiquinone biosynthesis (AarF/ABC1/UbiB family)